VTIVAFSAYSTLILGFIDAIAISLKKALNHVFYVTIPQMSSKDIKNQISKCKIKEVITPKGRFHNFDF
jgi:hypothetical protein